ncbi:MAG: NAD(+)/NADH kinase [Clostridiales bacterium]|nr:NAD(+)/NADH kinase [Candidatus Crickella caballi]
MSKRVYIYSNHKDNSQTAHKELASIIDSIGWTVAEEYDESCDLLVCIGGDGTFLSFVHKFRFPTAPIIGVNTGHLGFFQEASPENMEQTIKDIANGNYLIQNIRPVEAEIVTDRNTFRRIGINEILVRGLYSHVSQFAVTIGETKIQDFSGDGILVSTPVGSTAYNYSLDGALVSPDLDVLQLTPVAPMNTNAYRCFHSSILLPSNEKITLEGIGRNTNGTVIMSFDGRTHEFNKVKHVDIEQSKHEIHLIRFENYNYWEKLSTKLL